MHTTLSLDEVRSFDAQNPLRTTVTGETDACCPLCGGGKRCDIRHRSLSLNLTTGQFQCHRCGAAGKLREFWDEAEKEARGGYRERTRVFRPKERVNIPVGVWKPRMGHLQYLMGTPGYGYLTGRGLHAEVCQQSQVKYAPDYGVKPRSVCGEGEKPWSGAPAVVFPLRDGDGTLVGVHGRYLPNDKRPDALRMLTFGDRSQGVFATEGVWECAFLVVVEAPIDALSLRSASIPAIALCGSKGFPAWLAARLYEQGKPVWVATDADAAGDEAAHKLAELLAPITVTKRLRPVGAKDWNEQLQTGGSEALSEYIWSVLLGHWK